MSIYEDIRRFFISGNMVNRLIVVNIFAGLIYLFLNLLLGNSLTGVNIRMYYMLSLDPVWDLKHPWVFITHLFGSVSILHFIFSMFFIYWFGTIIGDLVGDKKILPLYILGGLSGAISFLILGFLFMPGTIYFIYGLDSIVLSFAIASAVLVPDYQLRLILIGNVRLKIVVFIFVFIEFLYAVSSYNPVYFSYIGSVIFGWFYIYSMRRGFDISTKFNKIINIFLSFKNKQNRNLSVSFKADMKRISNRENDFQHQKELDRILDKIKKEGYENLSEEEKEFLFLASKRE